MSQIGSFCAMFLTQDELAELTGKVRRDAQVRVLREMGYVFQLRTDGCPTVLKAYIEAMHGGNVVKITEREPQLRP